MSKTGLWLSLPVSPSDEAVLQRLNTWVLERACQGPQLSHHELSDSGRVPDPPRIVSVLLGLPARHSTAVGSLQAPRYRDPSDAGSAPNGAAPFLPELSCDLQSRKAALSRFAVAGGSPMSLFHPQVLPFSGLLPGLGSALLICADVEDGHSIKIVKRTPHEPGVHYENLCI